MILRNPCLAPSIFSLASRVLLSLSLSFSYLDAAQLSHDPTFHARMLRGLQAISLDLGVDVQDTMGENLGLIIRELLEPLDDPVSYVRLCGYKIAHHCP